MGFEIQRSQWGKQEPEIEEYEWTRQIGDLLDDSIDPSGKTL
jgi:hypothetical protein